MYHDQSIYSGIGLKPMMVPVVALPIQPRIDYALNHIRLVYFLIVSSFRLAQSCERQFTSQVNNGKRFVYVRDLVY